MRRCPRWRLREKSPSKSCLGKRSRQPVCTMKCAWKKKRWSTADPSGKLAAKITAATSPPTALSPATRSKDQVAKNSPVSRKLPNRKSASRIPMHPRRRILLPPTTPRGTIHRASETIAGRGRTVAGIAEGTEAEITGEDAGVGDVGDGGVAGAEAATGIAVDVTTARADEICRRQSTLRRRENAIREALIADAPMTGARWIAAQARQSNEEMTISCCRANRWRNTAGVRYLRRSSRWAITSPRNVNQILQSSRGVRRLACSQTPASRGVSPGVCRTGS